MRSSDSFPLVTIITPTYNRQKYIEETVKSVLSQDYPRLEYIILDDGSTDNTEAILKKYNKKIKYSKHKNMGEVKTVNKGLNMAHGEIIAIVNSDDPLMPNAIQESIKAFIKHPEIIVTYPDWMEIDGNGKKIRAIKTLSYDYKFMLLSHHCIPGPGAFFKKSILKKLNGRDDHFRYVSDFDFWLRAGLEGEFMRIPKMLATFRIHTDSQSVKNQGTGMADEHMQLTEKIFALKNFPKYLLSYKRQAICNAYIVASYYSGKNTLHRFSCYVKAFASDPFYFLKRILKKIL